MNVRGILFGLTNVHRLGKQMESATVRAFNGMTDALVNFVMTGKLDFRSLANSIISDLIRIQIQRAITLPLARAMSSFFGFADGGVPATRPGDSHDGCAQLLPGTSDRA